ncbi:GrpB family protein [Pseudomonas sichuanensis]|uniref:GrpB family protein n=1 Tax=Pseudomonas sichuanensis TaxID=2213015 RepID=UPI002160D625|nr:GrpB family protein [Pseudomonas sichuanensis]UVL89458.1 GrpB family protein [Pseudomonas sichuanensis]
MAAGTKAIIHHWQLATQSRHLITRPLSDPHKLHACARGHLTITQMLGLRDLLKRDGSICQQYEALKLQLESNSTGGMVEYLEKKSPLIFAALLHSGMTIPEWPIGPGGLI